MEFVFNFEFTWFDFFMIVLVFFTFGLASRKKEYDKKRKSEDDKEE